MENLTGCYGGLCNVSNLFQNDTREASIEEELDPFAMPTWRKVLWSLFYFLMVATADVGNIIVIWIVMSNARMRSVTNYFIINLSMADIINATFNVIPNFTYMLTGNWPFDDKEEGVMHMEMEMKEVRRPGSSHCQGQELEGGDFQEEEIVRQEVPVIDVTTPSQDGSCEKLL